MMGQRTLLPKDDSGAIINTLTAYNAASVTFDGALVANPTATGDAHLAFPCCPSITPSTAADLWSCIIRGLDQFGEEVSENIDKGGSAAITKFTTCFSVIFSIKFAANSAGTFTTPTGTYKLGFSYASGTGNNNRVGMPYRGSVIPNYLVNPAGGLPTYGGTTTEANPEILGAYIINVGGGVFAGITAGTTPKFVTLNKSGPELAKGVLQITTGVDSGGANTPNTSPVEWVCTNQAGTVRSK